MAAPATAIAGANHWTGSFETGSAMRRDTVFKYPL